MKIPKSAEIYPVYFCDECESRHCESLEYVNKIGKILCGCGNVIHLRPIESFKVSPVFKNQNATPPPTAKANVSDLIDKDKKENINNKKQSTKKACMGKEEFDKAKDTLVTLGYKASEARKKVESSARSWVKRGGESVSFDNNFEDFVEYMIMEC